MKKSYQKILVPTDFSETANNALQHACHWAKDLGAKIILFHADNVFVTNEGSDNDFYEKSEAQLRQTQKAIQSQYPELSFEIAEKEGVFAYTLNNLVSRRDIDLVIMGTEGSNSWETMFLGNHTMDVLEDLTVPVLVIPQESAYRPIKNIVFATNFENEDTSIVLDAVTLAEHNDAMVQIVHITTDDDEEVVAAEQEVMDWFKRITKNQVEYPNLRFRNVQTLGSVLSELQAMIESEQIDLVILSTKSKNFIKRLIEGSFVRKMANHSKVPFWVFHLNNE